MLWCGRDFGGINTEMAAESNTGFHREENFGSMNRHAISFQSGAINSTSEMIPMSNYFGMNSSGDMLFPGTSNIINNNPVISQAGNPSGSSLVLDSVPGLKHDTGLAVEWSVEEQYKLEDGLVKFSDEPSIMRYIKIAATLRDKTVRDVALRCRWMTRKRRKPEEHNVGKKVNNRKDKLVESSSKTNIHSSSPLNFAAYSLMMHHMDQNGRMPYEGIGGATKHLLEQNAQAFNQITANLSTYKLQDNINLFCKTRNNISAILNDMRDMPGIMSQMPPLPVCINEDLANNILPNTT
ncbi:uncharacterized protein LOC133878197 isoform X2 [Alnus glutinosa]|uniref:uncharacterized protein LOC133878197 isoform X2 n=1 Tax=Alnus glutinosa TaxID=3517 RepID=UPI002D79A2BE|nr:uncharacterized protein LOC133878197 isoform X2 [Alnus glutinosa]